MREENEVRKTTSITALETNEATRPLGAAKSRWQESEKEVEAEAQSSLLVTTVAWSGAAMDGMRGQRSAPHNCSEQWNTHMKVAPLGLPTVLVVSVGSPKMKSTYTSHNLSYSQATFNFKIMS